jgi:hypothetical protein
MDRNGSLWLTVFAAVCFLGAIAIVAAGLLLAAGLIREYGPAEGYGNIMLQTLPIVAVGVGVGGLLAWAGIRLTRRRNQTG